MGLPIGHPSICFMNLLLSENIDSLVNFKSNFLKIGFLQKGLIFLQKNFVQNITYRFSDRNAFKQTCNVVRNIFIRFIITTVFQ